MKVINWTEEEIEILLNNYGKIKINALLELLPSKKRGHVKREAYVRKLRADKNITNRKTEVDLKFFETPNNINSYYAGLIAADGNIRKIHPEITLNQKDRKVLEKYIYYLKSTSKISKRYNKKYPYGFCHSVSFNSQKMVDDLYKNFNIVPKKSLILQPPKNLDFLHSLCFIAGYIDGDGWISIIKKSKIKKSHMIICVLGTKIVCEWIKNVLGGVGCVFIKKKSSKNHIYQYTVSYSRALKIINQIRSIEEIKNLIFPRKWNKILEFNGERN